MKTKEEFESLVADLTELEMSDLIDACNQKLSRDKLDSLREQLIDEDNATAIEELEMQVEELETKNEKIQDKLDRAQNLVDQAISILNDI